VRAKKRSHKSFAVVAEKRSNPVKRLLSPSPPKLSACPPLIRPQVASFLCSLASRPSAVPLLLEVLECGGFDVSAADYVSVLRSCEVQRK
jgi:hypothetical protein